MAERIIPYEKSVIVAADVEHSELVKLVSSTWVVEGIGGYKIGLKLVLEKGLPETVSIVKNNTDLPVIFDPQKGATDIPDMGKEFAKVCQRSGVDMVILFPFAGPKTEIDWIHACQDAGMTVLVGAHMTHPEFLYSEGGFIADSAPYKIFTIAAGEGVRDFVVPGNRVEHLQNYKKLLDGWLGEGQFTLYAPGFVTQGGEISEFAKVAGERWHAIVGGAIYDALDITAAARQMVRQIK